MFLATIVGTNTSKICSHFYIVKNPQPVIRCVPAEVVGSVRLTLVGAMTTDAIAQTRIRFPLQLQLCKEFLQWLTERNSVYIENMDKVNLNAMISDDGCVIDRTNNSGDPVNTILLNRMVFGITSVNTGDATVLGGEIAGEDTDNRTNFIFQMDPLETGSSDYLARNSNNYSNNPNFGDLAMIFPKLLPYGTGGPTQFRLVKISVESWIRRALRITGGAFNQHWGFIGAAYDLIATKKAFTQQFIAMRVRTSAIKIGMWRKDEVLQCLAYKQNVDLCTARGLTVTHFYFNLEYCIYHSISFTYTYCISLYISFTYTYFMYLRPLRLQISLSR